MSDLLIINRKEQLLAAAAKLFKQKGYATTTMRDLAAEVGIEAASIYHHLKSKEEILELICFDMADKLSTAIQEVNDIYFNAEERLRMAIKSHVRILTQHPNYSAVFIHDWKHLSSEKLSQFIALRDAYEKGFRLIVKEGINEDVFDQVDERFAALTILSTLNWINEWYNPEGKMTADEIAVKLSDFIMGGLRKKLVTDINYKP